MIVLDQLQHLTHLIRFGLAADVLHVHQFSDDRVDEDMMAALDAAQAKAKARDQVDEIENLTFLEPFSMRRSKRRRFMVRSRV